MKFLSRVLLPFCFLGVGAAAQAMSPSDTVQAFHKALTAGDKAAAIALMGKEVTVFEQGFINASRDDYVSTQLDDAIRFAQQTRRVIVRREAWQDGNIAWVMSSTQTTGDFGGQALALEGAETMVLRLDGPDWKITHIHWSAHPMAAADR